MNLIEKYRIIERVHRRIILRSTGSADEFANSIGKSRRGVYDIIEELEDLGAEIHYSRQNRSFEYLNDFSINLKIEGKDIKGGENFFHFFLIVQRICTIKIYVCDE